MIIKTVLRSLGVTMLLFFFSGVYAQKDKGFNFPPELGKTETTILIREGSKDKITAAMIEAFEKEYKGKFEAETSVIGKKRSDTIYRYVFFVTEEEQAAFTVGRDRYPATTNYRFGLIDRTTGKVYQTEFLSGGYSKGAKYYAKHLEEFRKANGNR